jgi:D-aminoacyl-tRNA deacylase
MLAVVVSRADEASVRIGDRLLDLADWTECEDGTRPAAAGGGTVHRLAGPAGRVELRTFERMHLDLERPAAAFDEPDVVVFASRHAGETGPLLTAHHTGNFGPADHGGEANSLARAAPNAHARALAALNDHAPAGYDVGTECTHHGPTDVGAPSLFVELGSGPDQWTDPAGARAVAAAILDLRGVPADRPASRDNGACRHVLGVGGGHYAPRFERLVRETGWAVGHVAADWGLDALSDDARTVLAAALAASRADYALLDGDHPEAAAAVEAAGGRVVSETWLRATDGLDPAFVRRVEAVLTVDEGLRFGDPAAGYEGEFSVVDLPAELLAEARGIDGEATREVLERTALAFGTDQAGSRVTGPAVLATGDGQREAVTEGLLDVLRERYDSVERRGDTAVARARQFSPERARDLGVPEGPAFGRLADGEPVEVEGERVTPEAVTELRERQFHLEI